MVMGASTDNLQALKSRYPAGFWEEVQTPENCFQQLMGNSEAYCAVILDQQVSSAQKLFVLNHFNGCQHLRVLPVIIHANSNNPDPNEMNQFIRAGARYYLPVDLNTDLTIQILEAAVQDHARYFAAVKSVEFPQMSPTTLRAAATLQQAEFKFVHLVEAQALANLLSEACPNPRLTVIGLSEILINAVEHGNLNISYAEKTDLHSQDRWMEEVNRRINLPENKGKCVKVSFKRNDVHIKIRVVDQGKGFDWKKFQELDQKRVFDNHGRGIVMAKTLAFESLEYFGNGNEVECTISSVAK